MNYNSFVPTSVPSNTVCVTNYGGSCNDQVNKETSGKVTKEMQDELKKYIELQIGNQNKENEEKVYEKLVDRIKLELGKIIEGKDAKEVLSELSVTVNLETGEILDNTSGKSTGKTYVECVENFANLGDDVIMINSKGKLEGNCNDNVLCKECVEAINSSIVGKSFSTVPEETLLNEMLASIDMVNLV